MDDITLKIILQYGSYWVGFWTVVEWLLPPRELFNDFPGFQKSYNLVLQIVHYYGSLGLRDITVKLYGKLGIPVKDETKKDQ